jgi:hypothetical protein
MNEGAASLRWLLTHHPDQPGSRSPGAASHTQPADEELLDAYSRAVVGVVEGDNIHRLLASQPAEVPLKLSVLREQERLELSVNLGEA